MTDCNYIPQCGFYHDKLAEILPTAEFMKIEFCHKKPVLCARQHYYKAQNLDNMPDNLMPNETEKVKYITRDSSSLA